MTLNWICDAVGEKKNIGCYIFIFIFRDIHCMEWSVLEGLCGKFEEYISKAIKKDSKRDIV